MSSAQLVTDGPEATPIPTRFGPLGFASHQVWRAAQPLPGFEGLQRFGLISVQAERPFVWLQSLDEAAVSFLLVPAASFGLHYPALGAETLPLVMVVLPQRAGEPLRAHRQAPLLFDAQTGQFAQHIVEDTEVQGDGQFTPRAAAPLPADFTARMLLLVAG